MFFAVKGKKSQRNILVTALVGKFGKHPGIEQGRFSQTRFAVQYGQLIDVYGGVEPFNIILPAKENVLVFPLERLGTWVTTIGAYFHVFGACQSVLSSVFAKAIIC